MATKLVNGERVDMSAAEIAEKARSDAASGQSRAERINAKSALETSMATGIAKLKALGLSKDEIEALFGVR